MTNIRAFARNTLPQAALILGVSFIHENKKEKRAKMKRAVNFLLVLSFILIMAGCDDKPAGREASSPPPAAQGNTSATKQEAPVQGMITMVDLGADKCVPCKMMAPILAELEKEYQGRAAIMFMDVWKDKAPAERFGIRAIPTQIFFNENGDEVYRHVGFMSREDIVAQLKSMGVQ